VPAYTVAAFAKRFARLALVAPPAGAMIAIAFIHNLLRRHPALYVMIHNPHVASAAQAAQNGDETAGGDPPASLPVAGGAGVDPYNEAEADPAKSRAVESSLWEVEALRNHYCPQVRRGNRAVGGGGKPGWERRRGDHSSHAGHLVARGVVLLLVMCIFGFRAHRAASFLNCGAQRTALDVSTWTSPDVL
jgi:hypothetical protein